MARMLVLLSSLFFTAISSRLIFQHYGPATFAVVSIFATLQLMIPFADLGLGAVVMNRVARLVDEPGRSGLRILVQRVLKAQLAVVLIGTLCVAIVTLSGLTGVALHSNGEILPAAMGALAILLIFINVPVSIGNRLLIGAGKTHRSVLCSVFGPPLVFLMTTCATNLHVDGSVLYAAWPLSSLLVQTYVFRAGFRVVKLPIGHTLAGIYRVKVRDKLDPIFSTSASMLAISVASPISYNSARVVLGIFAPATSLATYSVGAQAFSPLLSLINTAATPLWPVFSRQPSNSKLIISYTKKFAALGLIAALIVLTLGPVYGWFITGDVKYVPWSVWIAFGVLLFVNSAAVPSMMRLNDGPDIRFQAYTAMLSCIANIPLAILLSIHYGAIGPIAGSIVCLSLLQVLPMFVWQYRNRSSEKN
ncbi:lipopolysaccharide biosynthesis protein [Rhodococcus sp. PML026]|uniref:lipopolysaccharide biosynthesis protein n=1 Tax=Rhodococcus sp. PML026 TaxID=1356405 RepID=UPI0018CD7E36|nr:oligosaccharide flippase family protein [Rhodococcus sp. PML026]